MRRQDTTRQSGPGSFQARGETWSPYLACWRRDGICDRDSSAGGHCGDPPPWQISTTSKSALRTNACRREYTRGKNEITIPEADRLGLRFEQASMFRLTSDRMCVKESRPKCHHSG